MLDSPEGVCAGQARFEYPATFVLFSNFCGILIVGPVLGAASALLGAWLGPLASANLEERRYRRQLRTEVYTKWLQFTENLATWALEPGADFAQTFLPKLHDMQAEVALVSSRSVSRAMQHYIDRLDPGFEAVLQSTGGLSDPYQIAYAAGVAFGRVMEEPRREVLNAMRADLGFEALQSFAVVGEWGGVMLPA